ncbi:MAG: ferritin-like domain-containing protein [Clostridiales bacterium]|jgi:rubrerythrin|nr:ferritin-like domain-containing protein [Clostridiales bacterium]
MDTYRSLSPDQKMLDILIAAVEEERESIQFYHRLSKMTKDTSYKEILRLIRMDEQKHEKYFVDIYKRLTGQILRAEHVTPSRGAEYDFAPECEKAMFAALELSEYYRRIYSSFSNLEIRDMLFEMITDEQNNAIKMQYLYFKNRRLI